jgi:hypothetical protein
MKLTKYLVVLFLSFSLLTAAEFTISSYNCGGLSNHYDYLRASVMQKLMQERYLAEPAQMALNEEIQKLALKILFASEVEKQLAQQEWERKGYQHVFEEITAAPTKSNSLNAIWNQKVESLITSYKVRPVVIHDQEVIQVLQDHLNDLTRTDSDFQQQLQTARAIMAKRIFEHHLKFDILCLQEADYLDATLFPAHYEVRFAQTDHSKNGIAWNTQRFELIETIGDILGRAFAVKLRDKETGKTVLVASGHLTGCNPYRVELNEKTSLNDSAKGDSELQTTVNLFDQLGADLMLVGMDSNVTSLHPRLTILKQSGYQLDYEHFLEPTCTNPYQVLNTRIDWIAVKSTQASVTNIPVLSIGLNNIQTNISDHKPVAAKISY